MADDTEREALARLICTVRSVRMMEDDQGREYRALVLEVDGSASGFTAADVWRATPMVLMRANDFAGYVSPSRAGRCPIGLDDTPTLCSAGCCVFCVAWRAHVQEIEERHRADVEAAWMAGRDAAKNLAHSLADEYRECDPRSDLSATVGARTVGARIAALTPPPDLMQRGLAGDMGGPMATAPKDGSFILIEKGNGFSGHEVVRWYEPWGVWLCRGDVPDPGDERFGIGAAVPVRWWPLPSSGERRAPTSLRPAEQEIARLTAALAHREAECARLRKALERIADGKETHVYDGEEYVVPLLGVDACRFARAALSPIPAHPEIDT